MPYYVGFSSPSFPLINFTALLGIDAYIYLSSSSFLFPLITAMAPAPNDEEANGTNGVNGTSANGHHNDNDDDDGEGGTKSKQFIMEIDYPTYLESIDLYQIEQSIIRQGLTASTL